MADSEKIDEQIEAAERKTRLQLLKEHMARIGEGMRGLGTGGVVGARMAGQAVTSAGTVVAPVVIKAKEAKARAAEIAKQHIPPVFIIIAVLGHILDAFTGFHATQFRIPLHEPCCLGFVHFQGSFKQNAYARYRHICLDVFCPIPSLFSRGFFNQLLQLLKRDDCNVSAAAHSMHIPSWQS